MKAYVTGAWAYSRGRAIECVMRPGARRLKRWVYSDTKKRCTDANERPCAACGLHPTADGHDACIADLPGVKAACCGHGVDWQSEEFGISARPYVMLENGDTMHFDTRADLLAHFGRSA